MANCNNMINYYLFEMTKQVVNVFSLNTKEGWNIGRGTTEEQAERRDHWDMASQGRWKG